MPQEITPRELARHIENGHPVRLIDVRQPWENAAAKLPESFLIPLNEIQLRTAEIPAEPGILVVLYCHHGIRSLSGVAILQQAGITNAASLSGGIDAWSTLVDPSVPRY